MRTTFHFIVILALLCATSAADITMAQVLPYPTDTINGKVFYRYPVQKGEGLYRISKNFGVSQEDIVKHNPDLQRSGLKLGQTILVPAIIKADSSLYFIHELQPKETLYGIAKLYGVKIAQIEELNPETSKTMRIGERLLIPKNDKQKGNKFVMQKMTDSQDVEIKKKIENEEFISEQTKHTNVIQQTTPAPADTVSAYKDTAVSSPVTEPVTPSEPLISAPDTAEHTIHLAVLLPFMTDVPKRDAAVERFMEFYEGLLIAVNKAQEAGQHFIIRAYDTDKTEARVQSILSDSALLTAAAVIGPAYPAQVSIMAEYAKQNHIPVVIPFTSKVTGIEDNPYLMQFNPTEQVEAKALSARIREKQDEVQCIFFSNNGGTTPLAEALRTELKQYLTPIEAPLNLLLTDSASYLFATNKTNIIVLPSDRYSAMQPAIRHLTSLAAQYDICLVSEYTWQKENISLKQIYTNLFAAKRKLTDDIIYKMMKQLYFPHELKNDAPRYDLLGYDITSWLISVMQQTEALNLEDKIQAVGEYHGLQSDLRFERISADGGWMNKNME